MVFMFYGCECMRAFQRNISNSNYLVYLTLRILLKEICAETEKDPENSATNS